MKVAITGHTKGLGKCLFDELSIRGHDVIGYSRSNGYDISVKETCDQILSNIDDFDVFINNAFDSFGQTYLLESLLDVWNSQHKVILNLNSKAIFTDVIPSNMLEYVEEKKKQIQLSEHRKLSARPQITNIILGLVDTEMSKNFQAKKLCPGDIAILIADIIEMKDRIYVQEIMLDVPFQDWNEITAV